MTRSPPFLWDQPRAVLRSPPLGLDEGELCIVAVRLPKDDLSYIMCASRPGLIFAQQGCVGGVDLQKLLSLASDSPAVFVLSATLPKGQRAVPHMTYREIIV